MIQRIQSLYLLLALILVVCLFFFPLAYFNANQDSFELMYSQLVGKTGGMTNYNHIYPIFILMLISIGGIIAALFTYKNRALQMKLCVADIFLTVLIYAAIYYYHLLIRKYLVSINTQVTLHAFFSITAYFPLIAGLLCYFAYKAIKKDDEMVKSADRIR